MFSGVVSGRQFFKTLSPCRHLAPDPTSKNLQKMPGDAGKCQSFGTGRLLPTTLSVNCAGGRGLPFRGAVAKCRGHASGGGNGKVVYIDTEGTLYALSVFF